MGMIASSSLSAAEALMLLFPRRSSAEDLLKITFSELCMKGILSIGKEYDYASARSDRQVLYTYVYYFEDELEGETLLPHQQFIVSLFEEEDRIKVTNLAPRIKRKIRDIGRYKKEFVHDALVIKRLLNPAYPLQKALELYVLTAQGKECRQELKECISEAENNLPNWVNGNDEDQLLPFLSKMNERILLLRYCWLEHEIDWETILPKIADVKSLRSTLNIGTAVRNVSYGVGISLGGSMSGGYSGGGGGFSYGGGDFGGGGASGSY